ncbi:MAG: S46 family peptidase [Bacteroidetes bacterium]|nr:S46 family peptidase [Bacteroidota bacterium]
MFKIKTHFHFILFLALAPLGLFAEEGMLIPSVIQAFESDMKARGMKLSARDIYDVNNASLKDAILHFNGGCTAELVSDRGLLLTNHHCGYSQIQSHSSLQNDYLKNGFWAKNLNEELPNNSLYAARMVRIDDVTKAIMFGINEGTPEAERRQKIAENSKKIIEDAQRGSEYKAEIKEFNYGNDYYIIVKEIFTDVRLVGTPPNAIGKFGGDTDNWVWPRHTGDFSVFRVYAGKDNKPAGYSKENVPYKPLHYLPISMLPRKSGDFTMVYGFPGTTEQHVVSAQIKHIVEKERPARVQMRESALSVIDAGMRSSDEVRIKYSAKQARIANAWKKWIGQIDGLVSLDAVQVKKDYEAKYVKRAETNSSWSKYATIVDKMNRLMIENSKVDYEYAVMVEYLTIGPEIFSLARTFAGLEKEIEDGLTGEALASKKVALQSSIEGFFKNYDGGIDQKIFQKVSETYIKLLGEQGIPEELRNIDLAKYTQKLYDKSFLTDKDRALSMLGKLNSKKIKSLKKDAAYSLYKGVLNQLITSVLPKYRVFNQQMEESLKVYVEGKYVMFPNEKHWADANGTLRITYGALEGSSPTDGMMYTEHTTTDGILAKHRTGNADFELLPDMVEKFKQKDFGPYAQDNELWVCFSGSNHTTGGNSGSPVIDGEGRLMGLNFDRSWESTMSDYMFDPDRCRNIVVDIRYVLWVMDKYAGATHLVDEMKLVK